MTGRQAVVVGDPRPGCGAPGLRRGGTGLGCGGSRRRPPTRRPRVSRRPGPRPPGPAAGSPVLSARRIPGIVTGHLPTRRLLTGVTGVGAGVAGPRLPAGHARRHAPLRAAQRRAGDPGVEREAGHRRRRPRGPGPGPALHDRRRGTRPCREAWSPATSPWSGVATRSSPRSRTSTGWPRPARRSPSRTRPSRRSPTPSWPPVSPASAGPWWATRAATTRSGGCPPGPRATGRRWKAVRSAPCW